MTHDGAGDHGHDAIRIDAPTPGQGRFSRREEPLRNDASMRRSLIIGTLKALVPIGLLGFLFFRYIDIRSLAAQLSSVSPWIASLCFLSILISKQLQSMQTACGLALNGVTVGNAEVFKVQSIASFYTVFLPGDLVGGGVSWYLLQSYAPGQRLAIVSGLVAAKLIYLASAVPFFAVGVLLDPHLSAAGLLVPAIVLTLAAVGFLLLPLAPSGASALRNRVIGLIEVMGSSQRFASVTQKIVAAIASLGAGSVRLRLRTLALSVAIHLIGALSLWLGAQAVGIIVPLDVYLWLWPLMILIHMVPISFAGLGVREVTLVVLLNGWYGIEAERALLLSMLIFAISMIFSALGGIFCLVPKRKN